ncbi:serine/threonine protein phosphatase [Erythrobacteraceae bacterium E2-1 Yellow Sea]|nr:serine/threonine protein phosphatase [Erythrobacteraceae bacterium E2-1 Yellow Sea]
MIFEPLLKLFRPAASKAAPSRVPDGERYYVIGDIHGRLDLFDALIGAIEADDASLGAADTTVVLLGDLVDRGAESAGVLQRAREWQGQRKIRILIGNHEEMFLQSFEDKEVLRHFLKHGGRETILSFGLPKKQFNSLSIDQLFETLQTLVPTKIRQFLAASEDMIVAGDYLFVHAGIDPTLPLDQQRRSDYLWIRERFLRHSGPLPKVVVHGHTIFDEVEDRGTRIGIDTGAFRTGILTALVLEGSDRRTIQAVAKRDKIKIKSANKEGSR